MAKKPIIKAGEYLVRVRGIGIQDEWDLDSTTPWKYSSEVYDSIDSAKFDVEYEEIPGIDLYKMKNRYVETEIDIIDFSGKVVCSFAFSD